MRIKTLYLAAAVAGLTVLAAAQGAGAKQQLIQAQDAARQNQDYQSHHYLATAAIAKAVGAPLPPLTDAKGNALPANDAAAKLAASGSGYREVSPEEAQKLADGGALVIVAWSNPDGAGHLATVRPTGVSGDDVHAGSRPPIINNVGVDQAVEGVNWVFRKSATIHYYTPGAAAGGGTV